VTDLRRVSGRVELSVHVLGAGEWQIADSKWQIVDGESSSHQPSAISHQPSAISHRPSAISHQPSATSGREYMLARLETERQTQAQRQQAEALAAGIHAHLDRLADESTHLSLVTSHLLLKAAYLVPRERVTDFRQEVESLCLAYPRLRFLCTGPWPAYSFITNDEAATQRLVETLTREPLRSTLCFLSESGNEQEHKDARD
ncbi:MAG: GvpL/GvpF family gas vesicle protein, partial [Anaerolineales bacterium]|nr:GvpL/GvpF family gas vesicle protein [Anaerolineales bacterium]